ncbi:hypothetical protein AB835_04995 [Candidatus Endobugula sertula]|uniref:SIMPL domain-containing protein n=1 Tax=Candidatus Endobugula sertula TaxID=62101 RepID=A0A1D2QRR8_9GAMM|nr:hypothetical protein AB835_04995 [Candidatus Endobugula sertula]
MYFQCFTLILLMSLSSQILADKHSKMELATLLVRGEAQLTVPPDQVSVVLGVTTESTSTKKAMADNAKNMHAIINGLKILGLKDGELHTQHFRVEPIWSRRPNNAGNQWRPHIVAYRIHNNLQITTQNIDWVGDIIEVATTSGANQVNSIRFSLSNPREYRERAIILAMQNAKADATTLAEASGNRIRRTLSLQLDNAAAAIVHADVAQAKHRSRLESFAPADMAPPINPGDITVSASVSVTYELSE